MTVCTVPWTFPACVHAYVAQDACTLKSRSVSACAFDFVQTLSTSQSKSCSAYNSSCVELIASQPWLLRTPSRSNRESIDPLSSYVISLCPCDRPRSLTLFLARASCGEEQHSRSASSSFASPFVLNTSTGSTQTISWSAVPGSCFWQVQSFGRPSKRPCTLNILFPLDRLSQHPRFSLPREYSYKLRWLPSFCSTPACGQ